MVLGIVFAAIAIFVSTIAALVVLAVAVAAVVIASELR